MNLDMELHKNIGDNMTVQSIPDAYGEAVFHRQWRSERHRVLQNDI